MRSLYTTVSAVVLAAYTSTLTGCVVADGTEESNGEQTQAESEALAAVPAPGKWDGPTLFTGLIFGTGPAAAAIYPELVRTGPMAGVTKDQLVSSLKSASSSFAAKGYSAAASTMSEAAASVTATAAPSYAASELRPTAEQITAAQDYAIATINTLDATFFTRFGTAMQSRNVAAVSNAMDEAASMAAISSKNKPATGKVNPVGGYWKYLDVAVAVEIVAVAVVFAFWGRAGGGNGGLQNDHFILNVTNRLKVG